MKTKIYYFSGTGNSLKVAKDIARELGDADIISMVQADYELNLSCDAVGLVFPVYAWGVPRIVVKFLKMLKTDRYVFVVLTHGGGPGKTMEQTKKIFAANDTKLSAGFEVHMPDNYLPMFNVTAEAKQQEMFFKEKAQIKEIAEIIKQKKEQQPKPRKGFFNAILSGPINKSAENHFRHMDKSFWTTDKCNSCEICYKVCPVGNIEMKEGRPAWKHDCEACMACIHWCPTRAIQYGKKTEKKGRYTHPEISLKEMLKR